MAAGHGHGSEAIAELGRECVDWGNVETAVAEATDEGDEHARFLPQILETCARVASFVERAVAEEHLPLVLGGDHSIALGTLGGLARLRGPGGVLWIDAHADLNRPETSPSGNVHGMALAAALEPDRVERAVLLDPAIDLLPHVGFDMAEDHRRDRVFGSVKEAIDAQLWRNPTTPRRFVEEEAREHLVEDRPGTFRWRYCQSAVVFAYGELCLPAPPLETLRAPTLLVHAEQFGLVRDDQLEAYRDRVETVAVPGGHMVIWDAYEETAGAVTRFLEDSSA